MPQRPKTATKPKPAGLQERIAQRQATRKVLRPPRINPGDIKIVALKEVKETINAVYYGPGGTGKTSALASLASRGRVLFVNAESGIKRKSMIKRGVQVDNVMLFPDPESGQTISMESLEAVFEKMREELTDDPTSWTGVCWDSGSEIVRMLLRLAVDRRVAEAEAKLASGQKVSEMLADRFFIDRDQYGEMSEQVRELFRKFRDLPCHFAVSCLQRRDVDQQDNRVHYGPAVNPALQGDFVGWPDIVCRTYVEETPDGQDDIFLGAVRPQGRYEGKDRFDSLPRIMVNPTMD